MWLLDEQILTSEDDEELKVSKDTLLESCREQRYNQRQHTQQRNNQSQLNTDFPQCRRHETTTLSSATYRHQPRQPHRSVAAATLTTCTVGDKTNKNKKKKQKNLLLTAGATTGKGGGVGNFSVANNNNNNNDNNNNNNNDDEGSMAGNGTGAEIHDRASQRRTGVNDKRSSHKPITCQTTSSSSSSVDLFFPPPSSHPSSCTASAMAFDSRLNAVAAIGIDRRWTSRLIADNNNENNNNNENSQQQHQQQEQEFPKTLNVVKSNMTDRRRKHKRRPRPPSFSTCFTDYYLFTEDVLGVGAQGVVCTCIHKATGQEYAVKLINKETHPDRQRVFKEMDIFHSCRDCKYILNLHEYFEDQTYFYLVFDKMYGGQLLHHILKRGHLNEREACLVTRQIAESLSFMHRKGLAHRDLKPENVLCEEKDSLLPIKLCDFDLASALRHAGISAMTTPVLSTPVGSAEFMAPEVVDAWVGERDGGSDSSNYDKRCDLWSLGVIIYIMLCGYPPFYGRCDNQDCGWDDGVYCHDCQYLLFCRIQHGEFSFPSPEWDAISDGAKDLISHLLVCDARVRYSAEQVLKHSWIRSSPPETALGTASVLKRDNSVRNLDNFTHDALSITKLIDNRMAVQQQQQATTTGVDDPDNCDSLLGSGQQQQSSRPQSCLAGSSVMPAVASGVNWYINKENEDQTSRNRRRRSRRGRLISQQQQQHIGSSSTTSNDDNISISRAQQGRGQDNGLVNRGNWNVPRIVAKRDILNGNGSSTMMSSEDTEAALARSIRLMMLDQQAKRNESSRRFLSSGGSSCGMEYQRHMNDMNDCFGDCSTIDSTFCRASPGK